MKHSEQTFFHFLTHADFSVGMAVYYESYEEDSWEEYSSGIGIVRRHELTPHGSIKAVVYNIVSTHEETILLKHPLYANDLLIPLGWTYENIT